MMKFASVSWQEASGNRLARNIDAAMLSDRGLIKSQKVQTNQYQKPRLCNVKYDREYLMEWLLKRVIVPLSVLGVEKIHEIIDEAWALYCKQSIDPKAGN